MPLPGSQSGSMHSSPTMTRVAALGSRCGTAGHADEWMYALGSRGFGQRVEVEHAHSACFMTRGKRPDRGGAGFLGQLHYAFTCDMKVTVRKKCWPNPENGTGHLGQPLVGVGERRLWPLHRVVTGVASKDLVDLWSAVRRRSSVRRGSG